MAGMIPDGPDEAVCGGVFRRGEPPVCREQGGDPPATWHCSEDTEPPTTDGIAASLGVPAWALRAALSRAHPDASPQEVAWMAAEMAASHPYSRPFDSRNGPCAVCGRYEEDGPHIAADPSGL